jgi:hypothetical protein
LASFGAASGWPPGAKAHQGKHVRNVMFQYKLAEEKDAE